jgi:hypothetical protein
VKEYDGHAVALRVPVTENEGANGTGNTETMDASPSAT